MLMQSGTPIAQIAYECGYRDPFHFSRQIRKEFSKTPRDMRAGKGFRPSSIDLEVLDNTSF
jgi:AraC family L-rhamnose operon regulatory protein RhaS